MNYLMQYILIFDGVEKAIFSKKKMENIFLLFMRHIEFCCKFDSVFGSIWQTYKKNYHRGA